MTNSNEAKATPRPWKIDSMAMSGRMITDRLGESVAEVTSSKVSAREDASLIVKAVNGMNGNLWECVNAFLEINGYRYPVESKNHQALSYYVSQIEKSVLEDSANASK